MSAEPSVSYLVGDARVRLTELAESSVDLVLTSPPFLALRSYLPAEHPHKGSEMGSETSPGVYVDALLDVIEECRRVLAPHGSIAVELGDTYAGSGGAGGDYSPGHSRQGQPLFSGSAATRRESKIGARGRGGSERDGWPQDKSLCLVPEIFRFALAHGFNPLTGRETQRWRIRNVVRWCRPNPPVGALSDKFRPATTDIVVACPSGQRYFDLDAVRQVEGPTPAGAGPGGPEDGIGPGAAEASHGGSEAPPKDWWAVPAEGYSGSHYATWPARLLTRPILAMCPRRVCTVCGRPSIRTAHTSNAIGEATGGRSWRADPRGSGAGHTGAIRTSVSRAPSALRITTGLSDCGCEGGEDRWRTGVVLDPFAGTATTLAVAFGHGRSAIGIDLDPRNVELARARLGMWMPEDHGAQERGAGTATAPYTPAETTKEDWTS